MTKKFFIFYNSVILAFVLSFIGFKNVWLEMRVNIGMLVPIFTLILCVLFYLFSKNKNIITNKNKVMTLFNLLFCSVSSFLILGGKSLKVVPASIIREGFGITHVKFAYINNALIVLLVIGLIIIMIKKVDSKTNEK